MAAKWRGALVPSGLLCLSLSVLIGRLNAGSAAGLDFVEGLFAGLAVALSVAALVWHGLAESA